jgi:hypothetical protein
VSVALSGAARKAALTVHVVSSVGWLGAVAAFLVLAVTALSAEAGTARALYIAMETLGLGLLVPLSLVSFASGLVQSLGTPWGLLRHYWVVLKLAISLLATSVLLLYTSTLTQLADAARSPGRGDDVALLPSASPVLHSGAAVVVLLVAAVLSVYKPRGLTRYGWHKQRSARAAAAQPS